MAGKDARCERALIAGNSPKRPYGARLLFHLRHAQSIGELENVTILLDSGAYATLQPAPKASWEGGRNFCMNLEGFPTASDAEQAGMRATQALLFSAISLDFGLRLVYRAHRPATVYERFRPKGSTASGELTVGWAADIVVKEIIDAYRDDPFDEKLLLSMELFCASLLETNERTRFVTAVSALEPLAEQVALGPAVASYVDECLSLLGKQDGINQHIRSSLRGRVNQLKQESVRQSLRRLAQSSFPGQDDVWACMDRAYALRSELLHDGALSDRDIDLGSETNEISGVLRRVYEAAAGRKLRRPTAVA